MATKHIALGTILKTDIASDGVFVAHTLVEQITPPNRTREEIDAKVLGDTLDVPLTGIEGVSRMELVQHWEPDDTEHENLDTAFDANAEYDFQIVTPHDTPITDEFSGKVVNLGPETLEPSGAYKRSVTILRTSDITRS